MDAERRIENGTFTQEIMARIGADVGLRHGRLIQVTHHPRLHNAVLTFQAGRGRDRVLAPALRALRLLSEVSGRPPHECIGEHYCYTAADGWLVTLDPAEVPHVADR